MPRSPLVPVPRCGSCRASARSGAEELHEVGAVPAGLEAIYPIVYLDALIIQVRHEKRVTNESCFLVIGIGIDGQREALGFWIAGTEGAKLWSGILTEPRNWGVQDILVAFVDGLEGFPEAIESVNSVLRRAI